MRRAVFVLLCLLVLFGALLPVSVCADNGNVTVYVTRTGYAYHRADCYHLRSRIPMSLREAVKSGYSPCKDCNPPRPDFADSVATAPPRSRYSSGSVSARSSGSSGSALQPFFDWLNRLPGPVFIFFILVFFAAGIFCTWLVFSGILWLLFSSHPLLSRFINLFRRERR